LLPISNGIFGFTPQSIPSAIITLLLYEQTNNRFLIAFSVSSLFFEFIMSRTVPVAMGLQIQSTFNKSPHKKFEDIPIYVNFNSFEVPLQSSNHHCNSLVVL